MSNFQFVSAITTFARTRPIIHCPSKKMVSETRVEVMDPDPWLHKHRVGKETHFKSGYSSHWFKIMFPIAVAEFINEGHNFCNQITLNFKTIDSTKITNIEIYNWPTMIWNNYDIDLHGNYWFSIGPDNCWEFDPALKINYNFFIAFAVSFGDPKIYCPEFVFYAARALLSSNENVSPVEVNL